MLHTQKYLEIVRKRGEVGTELRRVYRMIRHKDFYLSAYSNLYANAGATTKGVDPKDTIDGMSLQRIDTIIAKLTTGTYQWKPVRRTYIPKKTGKKTRPIGVPCWSDKLLQEVMRLVLEAYYEPQFRSSSHGFRPTRGCHTALAEIHKNWVGTKWFIEGDLKACFDSLDHDMVVSIIGRKVKDERFLKLLRDMLKAGYMENWKYHVTYSGTPQGGVISPLIMNIVLNELDTFVEDEVIPTYTKGTKQKQNPTYTTLTSNIRTAQRNGKYEEYHALQQARRKIPCVMTNDPEYRRLKYVRYADDFILGFIGSKAEAETIKTTIGTFLKHLKLTLTPDKTFITHAATQKARFLNYDISVMWSNSKIVTARSGRKMRAVNGNIWLSIPKDVTKAWIARVTKNKKIVHRPELLFLSDYDIVSTYETELQGLIHYYTMSHDVVKKMGRLRHYYWISLAKTLANKHKTTTVEIYQKYIKYTGEGRQVIAAEIPREGKKPLRAVFGKKPIRQNRNIIITDTCQTIYDKTTQLVTRLLANTCELCGNTTTINVHHIRKLKDLKKRYQGRKEPPKWVKRMIAIRRKTLIVCEKCHRNIHAGTYDDVALT